MYEKIISKYKFYLTFHKNVRFHPQPKLNNNVATNVICVISFVCNVRIQDFKRAKRIDPNCCGDFKHESLTMEV